MKIHINSLNQILFDFVRDEALPKYENIWRSQGDTEASIQTKIFFVTMGVKLGLSGDLVSKYPLLSMYLDSRNRVDFDNVKNIALETLKEFKDNNKKVVIPKVLWELDEDDINKIYTIAQKYQITEEN